jgi:hypothetical protein
LEHSITGMAVVLPTAFIMPVIEQVANAIGSSPSVVRTGLMVSLIAWLASSYWEMMSPRPVVPRRWVILAELAALAGLVALAFMPSVVTLYVAIVLPAVARRFSAPLKTGYARRLAPRAMGRFYSRTQWLGQGLGFPVRTGTSFLVVEASLRWAVLLIAVCWLVVVILRAQATWPDAEERPTGGRKARRPDRRREPRLRLAVVFLCAVAEMSLQSNLQAMLLRCAGRALERAPFGLAAVDAASYVVNAVMIGAALWGFVTTSRISRHAGVRPVEASIAAARPAVWAAYCLLGAIAAILLGFPLTGAVLVVLAVVHLQRGTLASNAVARSMLGAESLRSGARVGLWQGMGLAVGTGLGPAIEVALSALGRVLDAEAPVMMLAHGRALGPVFPFVLLATVWSPALMVAARRLRSGTRYPLTLSSVPPYLELHGAVWIAAFHDPAHPEHVRVAITAGDPRAGRVYVLPVGEGVTIGLWARGGQVQPWTDPDPVLELRLDFPLGDRVVHRRHGRLGPWCFGLGDRIAPLRDQSGCLRGSVISHGIVAEWSLRARWTLVESDALHGRVRVQVYRRILPRAVAPPADPGPWWRGSLISSR